MSSFSEDNDFCSSPITSYFAMVFARVKENLPKALSIFFSSYFFVKLSAWFAVSLSFISFETSLAVGGFMGRYSSPFYSSSDVSCLGDSDVICLLLRSIRRLVVLASRFGSLTSTFSGETSSSMFGNG